MERTLETQRVKLLRLLAGWFTIVELVSMGPLRVELPRWMRSFLQTVLIRAEFAAQSLVIVAACVAVKNGAGGSLPCRAPSVRCSHPTEYADDVPSTLAILRRMRALRALLKDLPRRGLRLLRTARRPRTARCQSSVVVIPELHDWALAARRIERPPDKARLRLPD